MAHEGMNRSFLRLPSTSQQRMQRTKPKAAVEVTAEAQNALAI